MPDSHRSRSAEAPTAPTAGAQQSSREQSFPIRLISAKLLAPRLARDFVPRPRLVEQLNAGLSQKLILVCGPPGFGKTTLLTEWLQQLSCPAAWLTLDESDNSIYTFLTYVVAALRSKYPESGRETFYLLGGPALPPLSSLVSALARDFDELPGELVMVLDDLHQITDMAIYQLLDGLIRYLPPMVHLAFGTRADPPLPLVTLRARAQLAEVRQRALRFTPEETRAFLARASSLSIEETTAAALSTRTDGWAAGLRLFLLSAHDEAELDRLAQGTGLQETDVITFLADEVLSKQPPAVVSFLLGSAVVDRFSLPLCRALFEGQMTPEEVEEMLAHVRAANLFVVTLGEGWYRYHPLFHELLLIRLPRQVAPEAVLELHRRAAAWYEGQGFVREALRHLLRGPDETLAIELLARWRVQAINQEQWQQLGRWLALFPRRLVERQPALSIIQAWIYSAQFKITEYLPLLPQIASQLEQEGAVPNEAVRQAIEGEIEILYGQAHFFAGKYESAALSARRGLELLPVEQGFARALAYGYLAQSLNHMGDQAGAHATLARGMDENARSGALGPRILIAKFGIEYLALDYAAAEETIAKLVALGQLRGAELFYGWLAYERDQLDAARQHFEASLARANLTHGRSAIGGYLALALVAQAQGREEEALHTVEETAALARESNNAFMLSFVQSFAAFLALLQGKTQEAVVWAEGQTHLRPFVPTEMSDSEPPIVLLKTLVAEGSELSLHRASALLSEYLPISRRSGSHMYTAEFLALQARLRQLRGENDTALKLLGEAVILARQGPSLRIFAGLGRQTGQGLRPLLEQLNLRGLAPDYLPGVLAVLARLPALKPAGPAEEPRSASQNFGMVESLTVRELEVLGLLADGLSNREIGAQLYLSPKTVENYTLSLYGKLGVNKRGLAVARARAIGLLPR